MKKYTLHVIAITAAVFLSGCGGTKPQYIAPNKNNADTMTMSIDTKDFEATAAKMVKSMLDEGVLDKKGGGRYVLMMSDVVNDTTQRINTRMLTAKIKKALRKSKKVVFTNAMGAQRDDTTVAGSRSARGHAEFNQKTVAKEGSLIAAQMGLAGRIIQKTSRVNDDDQKVEYWFQMELTNVSNGLEYWNDEVIVEKLGSNETVSW